MKLFLKTLTTAGIVALCLADATHALEIKKVSLPFERPSGRATLISDISAGKFFNRDNLGVGVFPSRRDAARQHDQSQQAIRVGFSGAVLDPWVATNPAAVGAVSIRAIAFNAPWSPAKLH